MARRKSSSYRFRLLGIVLALLVMVCGVCVLSTIQERYGYNFGLPELRLRFLDALFDAAENFAAGASGNDAVTVSRPVDIGGELQVHMIDVGQAESLLIIAPEKTVLIDAGQTDKGPTVHSYLTDVGVQRIDILIATHPHADHIGGMDYIIDNMPVDTVILPNIPGNIIPSTNTFTSLLQSIENAELEITVAAAGDQYDLGGGAVLTLLGPLGSYNSLNNISVVSRLEYGETSFLFTGDAEQEAEADLLNAYGERLASTVLSAGHHGSSTSTTEEFLYTVSPRIALISCGLDNSYGHPHREVLERLAALDVRILRADLHGSVVLVSDGESVGILSGS